MALVFNSGNFSRSFRLSRSFPKRKSRHTLSQARARNHKMSVAKVQTLAVLMMATVQSMGISGGFMLIRMMLGYQYSSIFLV